MIDEATARATAEARVASWPASASDDDAFVIWNVEEHSRAWVFAFNTRRWVRTRELRDQAVGASPLVVDKATGELHVYGSGPEQYAAFKEWLDE